MNMLGEQAEPQPAGANDFAAVGCLLAAEQTKDRGLAGTVATYQTDVLTRINLERCAAQNVLRAVGLINIG